MEEDVLQRIQTVMRESKITENALADGDGATQKRLNRQISHGGKLTLDTVLLILEKTPTISAEWLLRGEGSMLKGESGSYDKRLVEMCKSLVGICEQKESVMGQLASLIKDMEG